MIERPDETQDEHDQRIVRQTGEAVRKDCIRLAKRYNAWILQTLRSGPKTMATLYYRIPKDWKRDDLQDELEWMEVLDLVCRDVDDEGEEVWCIA
jgi:hypothetical protein